MTYAEQLEYIHRALAIVSVELNGEGDLYDWKQEIDKFRIILNTALVEATIKEG